VLEDNFDADGSTNFLWHLVGRQLLLSTGHADIASDLLEVPVFPVSSSDASHASPPNDATARTQVFGITAELSSLSLEDIRNAQAVDDSLQLVIQALVDGVKPTQESLRDYPEEARILFFQWDSLVLPRWHH